jgi:hypothetical protein
LNKHPGAPQRQLSTKLFRETFVDAKERVYYLGFPPKPNAEKQFIPPLFDSLFETAPGYEEALIG